MPIDIATVKRKIDDHSADVMGKKSAVKTSVFIPLIKYNDTSPGELSLLFEKRAEDLDIQPGDVCFPGGFQDSNDGSPKETALREATEELGTSRKNLSLWGEFNSMLIPWQLEINTFVGQLNDPEDTSPDRTEVDEIFSVSLKTALKSSPEYHEVPMIPSPKDDFPYEKIPGGENYTWRPRNLPELFYDFNDHVVWGITARILNEFLRLIDENHPDPKE